MKAAWLLVFFVATSAWAADPLRKSLSARDWTAGSAACEQLLENEGRRPDGWKLDASHFAERASLCAAIASGAGAKEDAAWWWSTALAMDSKRALALLPEFQGSNLLMGLPPPRTPVKSAGQKLQDGQVILSNGEIVAGEAVKIVSRSELPQGRQIPPTRHSEVVVEVLVDSEGRPTQPLLVSAKALPLQAFQAFGMLRQWRFNPARVNGQAVPSVLRVTVSMMAARG